MGSGHGIGVVPLAQHKSVLHARRMEPRRACKRENHRPECEFAVAFIRCRRTAIIRTYNARVHTRRTHTRNLARAPARGVRGMCNLFALRCAEDRDSPSGPYPPCRAPPRRSPLCLRPNKKKESAIFLLRRYAWRAPGRSRERTAPPREIRIPNATRWITGFIAGPRVSSPPPYLYLCRGNGPSNGTNLRVMPA